MEDDDADDLSLLDHRCQPVTSAIMVTITTTTAYTMTVVLDVRIYLSYMVVVIMMMMTEMVYSLMDTIYTSVGIISALIPLHDAQLQVQRTPHYMGYLGKSNEIRDPGDTATSPMNNQELVFLGIYNLEPQRRPSLVEPIDMDVSETDVLRGIVSE